MSIWGKIVGGAAGFALGGPLGAMLGGLAGHAVDRLRGDDTTVRDGTKQIAFTIGVIVLGAKMAKADGIVTRDEIEAFREVFHIPDHEVRNVATVFDRARRDADGYEPYAHQIAKLFEQDPSVLEDLMAGLFHIARADNVIHPAEIDFLRGVAEIFGIKGHDFDRIRASHIGADQEDPYTILGVPHDISDVELRRHYRELIRENHPDRAMAKGLPEEFIDLANEKMAAINAAYERVAQHRGIN